MSVNTRVTESNQNQTFHLSKKLSLFFLHLLFYRVGEEDRGTKGSVAWAGAVTITRSLVASCSGEAIVRAGNMNLHS